ncbi:MAG: hypothetical protein AAE983_03075 [Thermoplasmataceae archaeon]|jgi:hypothetical protein
MIIIDDSDLNHREKMVLEKYSEKPWRPEELSSKLRREMSRPTFYRAHRLLLDNFSSDNKPSRRLSSPLIYEISEDEKKQFSLVDSSGNPIKGKYYFRKDERKAQKWNKIMQKIRDYNGQSSPYNPLALIQREFSGYPTVSPEDVIEIAIFHGKIPEEDLYNCEEELFKFLDPQIKRLSTLLKEEYRIKMSVAVRAIFESCTDKLFGATKTNVNNHSKKSYDILCYTYTENEATNLFESLFAKKLDVSKEQSGVRANLISDIAEVFSEHFGVDRIAALLETKIRELEDMEIELSFDSPKDLGNVTQLKNVLMQAQLKLNGI